MKVRYRDVTLIASSAVLMALAFRIALVVLELRMLGDAEMDALSDHLGMTAWTEQNGTSVRSSSKALLPSALGLRSKKEQRRPNAVSARQSTNTNEFSLDSFDAPECLPLLPDEVTFTLVTQCGDERVPLVAQLCQRWNGPLAAAVFSNRSGEEIMLELVALGCSREQLSVDKLTPSTTLSETSYPVNHLRNTAIELVKTSHMVYMDVDFFPSDDLESTITGDAIRSVLASDYRHALVIPAFEYQPKCQSNCSAEAELLGKMPRSKADLLRLFDAGDASVFHDYWPPAHDTTDYAMWKQQAHGSLLEIPCVKSNHYEPYLIVRKCQAMPRFPESFTGYGFNKASFTMHLQAAQYRFSQVGGIFCTHFPHAVSKAKEIFIRNKHHRKGQRLQMERLVTRFASWLNSTYWPHAPIMPYCDSKTGKRK